MLNTQAHEPIAIIGLGCRFPKASGPAEFWRLLVDGVDAITEIPPSRFPIDALYDPRPAIPGRMQTRWGGFLENIEWFDAAFFGISPREAERLDPQQRLLLETAWEALEDAGQVPERLNGADVGVFVAMWINDFEARLFADPRVDLYMTTGSGRYAASGRLSYTFGFQGPSLTVDTACSSSLVAVHLACQSLWSGESIVALAGAANTILQPHVNIAYSQSQMLSPDGRCKFGDARANGYVRSEGAAVVVLKRLGAALAEGDPIYATILASAVNNDGRTSGFMTTPGRAGQEDMLRKAYRRAGRCPGHVQYVEAHGTGTRAGDPVELQALGTVLAEGRAPGLRCAVGSVKTNIGHTEGAAGLAGLIKVALSLSHRTIPVSLHLEHPNPAIPWEELPLFIPRERQPWPASDALALAGVSAFGIAGTNAHVVLEEAPSAPTARPTAGTVYLLPVSAGSPEALKAMARAYCDFLREPVDASRLADVCYTASVRRTHHEHRLAVVGRTAEEMARHLAGFVDGAPMEPGRAVGGPRPEPAPGIVFVFPGQGSQWLGMGRELLEREPAFHESLKQCDRAIRAEVGWSLIEELAANESCSRLGEIDVVQPLLFSIQVGLAALWRSWGIAPNAVVGHSMGEVAAAHVAGALPLEEAVRIICRRSRLLRRLSGRGAMAVVGLPLEGAREALAPWADRLSVAVSNGPTSTVVSGEPEALGQLLDGLRARDVFCRHVQVNVASHSPQVDALREDLLAELRGLAPRSPAVACYSTVMGGREDGRLFDAEYWVRNLREPVLFYRTVQRLIADGHTTFLEMSPHPVLLAPIEAALHELGAGGLALPSLHREQGEPFTMLSALGALYAAGHDVDWRRLHPQGGDCVRLPSYPWQRKRFWLDVTPAAMPQSTQESARPVRYQVTWQPKERGVVTGPARAGRWLILADSTGIGRALKAGLEERGTVCQVADASEDPLAALDRALQEASLAGVVHMRSLDAAEPAEHAPSQADTVFVDSCLEITRLVQRLLSVELPPRLWVITRGVQAVPPCTSAPRLAASPLWGLGRVAALEHPEVWGGMIDLDPATSGDGTHGLLEELLDSDDEDQIALRGGLRLVPRLIPVVPGASRETLRLSPDASYLVTGGLGGVGLQVARWMAQRGAQHLVLLGRTGLPDRSEWPGVSVDSPAGRRIAAVNDIETLGVRVTVVAADVADHARMEAVLEQVRAVLPPLRGIIHAAGVLTTEPLAELGEDSLRRVLHAKATGAWVLHLLTRGLPLDFFVLFSSGASVWGSRGFAHYAAANHCLDTVAHIRRASGLPAVSVNWGWFAGGGMEKGGAAEFFRQIGLKPMVASEALAALEQVMRSGAVQETVAAVDWGVFRPLYETKRRRPLLERLADEKPREGQAERAAPTVHLAELLGGLGAAERRERLRRYVAEEAARVLGFDSPDAVDPRKGFFKQGMDSLLTVQLRNRLEASLGRRLPPTIAFEYPTVEALSGYLDGQLAPAAAPPAPAVSSAPAASSAGATEEMSEEDLTALLAEKVRRRG